MKMIVICGPTASGKTALSIGLAKRLNTSIINCDSMQIYRHLDIGTAKATQEEQKQANHYLIDIINPHDSFSVQKYQDLAIQRIKQENAEGRVPIIVGGTGLFIQSLLSPLNFQDATPNAELRKVLEEESTESLIKTLKMLNPEKAEQTDGQNRQRLIRAIEIAQQTNGELQSDFRAMREGLNALVYGIQIPRPVLLERIERRVDVMLDAGLLDEVAQYFMPNLRQVQAAQAIGYNECIQYFKGLATYEEMHRLIILHTRQYAKRQMTWFRRVDGLTWIDGEQPVTELIDHIEKEFINAFN